MICDDCLTAAYDDLEGLSDVDIELQREVCFDFGKEIPDHNCDGGSCECACNKEE